MKRVIAAAVLLLFTASSSIAGWLDSWFDQHISSAPNYFEGQKRGYFTAGSFSARIPSSTDYLLSMEPPRLKAGCGGIDVFMGGFGFTNFDYLVQKFQRLIQAAPIVAFQIALNTLSSTLSTEISKVEEILNTLNSLQLNECGLMKPFTTINLSNNDVEKQFTDAAEAAIKTTGLTDLFNAIFAEGSAVKTKSGSTPPASEQYAGCGTELQALINGANSNTGVVGYIASLGGYSDLAPIIRGMIGDVVISSGPSTIYGSLTPACYENAFGAFKEGNIFRKASPFAQECTVDSVTGLRDKVAQDLLDARLAIKTKGQLRSSQTAIFQISPLPAYSLVKYSAISGDPSLLPTMADPIAKGMLFQAFLDVYINLYRIIGKMEDISKKTNNSSPDKLCNVEHVVEKLRELARRAKDFYEYAEGQYTASLGENRTTLDIAYKYKQFEQDVYKELSEKFSTSVAQRVLGK